jgi:hypothetical protein
MAWHAKVLDGEILERRDFEPSDQSKLADGKPRWLPIITERPEYDPVAQVLEGPQLVFERDQVIERYTAHVKSREEIDSMILRKDVAIEAEFNRRWQMAIAFPIGGKMYDWHADGDAVTNIMGVTLQIALGVPVPDPRPWTPVGADEAIDVTHAELVGLGATIAQRKDRLFAIKKARQKALFEMTDPKEIDAVDPSEGWDI